jgi:hypothetical protein
MNLILYGKKRILLGVGPRLYEAVCSPSSFLSLFRDLKTQRIVDDYGVLSKDADPFIKNFILYTGKELTKPAFIAVRTTDWVMTSKGTPWFISTAESSWADEAVRVANIHKGFLEEVEVSGGRIVEAVVRYKGYQLWLEGSEIKIAGPGGLFGIDRTWLSFIPDKGDNFYQKKLTKLEKWIESNPPWLEIAKRVVDTEIANKWDSIANRVDDWYISHKESKMKTINIEKEFQLPGTDVVLEKGDTVRVSEGKVHYCGTCAKNAEGLTYVRSVTNRCNCDKCGEYESCGEYEKK